ncbi:hypothetical protein HHI36_013463 [Cryptolaemus montrouzieri]|uniref:Mutator-like transposase domain-containing protein n=1 Tax=Cryptolaemus montrouzieri TaxID=559131 RepID=A0ABD2NH90_9CUCU
MDLGRRFNQNLYYTACTNIAFSAECLAKVIFQKAGRVENEKNVEHGFPKGELTVSSDGTWAKRGFSSLIGICTLIGEYTGKILDCFVSSKTSLSVTGKFVNKCEKIRSAFGGIIVTVLRYIVGALLRCEYT